MRDLYRSSWKALKPPGAQRREFLKFLAGSPLLAAWGWPTELLAEPVTPSPAEKHLTNFNELISSADEALNVFDFATVAEAKLPPAHWAYIETGVESDATLQANRKAFSKYYLRPRRLIDVTKIDMSVKLFGVEWASPILLAPAGSQKGFHDDGELATAKAAREERHLQILSCVSTVSVAEVAAARGAPVWYQLYPSTRWDVTQGLIRRGQEAGCPVLVLTIDQLTDLNRETLVRAKRKDTRDCSECHVHPPTLAGYLRRKPMFNGLNTSGLVNILNQEMTWDFVRRLRRETTMKLVLKGIVTREDAKLSLEHGVDGVIVSNHGGRAEESGWASLDSLPEVVESIGGRIPVMVDGGFRRGSDIFKALALGADAVGIGRPYLWGLAAFGQAGVEKVLQILRLELELAMKTTGARSLKEIRRNCMGSA